MGKKKINAVVFCDAENKEFDSVYAEKLIEAFRERTGWKAEEGSKIYQDLIEFSKGYSSAKRDVQEVCVIFMLAVGLVKI